MLENPTPAGPAPADSAPVVKRYAPPNQRNRSLNRRKSGDRFDRSNNIYGNDGEKSQQHAISRNNSVVDHTDVVTSNIPNENSRAGLIPLGGCSRSSASQLLNDRWAAVMHSCNDSSFDSSERPVMYPGSSASAWGQFRLPHQFMTPANNVGPASSPQMDFLSELRRSIRNANTSSDN